MHRSNQDVINSLPEIDCEELSPPPYTSNTRGRKVMLGAKIMEKHMTDEGYQLQQGLAHTDYTLAGAGLTLPHIDVPTILHIANPSTLVIQDKREWDGRTENYGRSRADWMRFQNLSCLRDRTDIFKVTVLKDAQAYPPYFRHFGDEVGIHSWIHYYNRGIVKKLAPYVRAEHCIRTYHSIDADAIPVFDYNRDGALLSGAVSRVYPLRKDLFKRVTELPNVTVKPHPGYKATGCHTPEYLKLLSKFKVVICTCSKFGYALRRLIEATCCGCTVITDLPVDENLPAIEHNLHRVSSVEEIIELLPMLYDTYDPIKQYKLAQAACKFYDYRAIGLRLSVQIDMMKDRYLIVKTELV